MNYLLKYPTILQGIGFATSVGAAFGVCRTSSLQNYPRAEQGYELGSGLFISYATGYAFQQYITNNPVIWKSKLLLGTASVIIAKNIHQAFFYDYTKGSEKLLKELKSKNKNEMIKMHLDFLNRAYDASIPTMKQHDEIIKYIIEFDNKSSMERKQTFNEALDQFIQYKLKSNK
jgi:hypothetical protein